MGFEDGGSSGCLLAGNMGWSPLADLWGAGDASAAEGKQARSSDRQSPSKRSSLAQSPLGRVEERNMIKPQC